MSHPSDPESCQRLARAWGRECLRFESWPEPAALPSRDDEFEELFGRMPDSEFEWMRGATQPGGNMAHAAPLTRRREMLERLEPEGMILRAGNLARYLPEAARWSERYREVLARIFGRSGAARSEVRVDVYLAAPGAITRFHADPSHNLVHQWVGTRTVTAFSPDERRLINARTRPLVFSLRGEHPRYREDCAGGARTLELAPGQAIYLPLIGPHWLQNGPQRSISFTVSLRTPEVFREKECHNFNQRMARLGLRPSPFGGHPLRERVKAATETMLRHVLPLRERRPDQAVTWED